MSKATTIKKRITAALAAGTLMLTLPLAGCNKSGNDSSTASGSNINQTSESAQPSRETKFGDDVVAKSKNYKITYPVMEYIFNYMFKNFCNTYGTSYFDTTKDLHDQYYNEEEKISWYDYFYNTTKNYMTQILVFSEGAKEAGLEVTKEEKDKINSNFELMESAAKESSMTLESYIAKEYGDEVTKENVEQIQSITVLAQDYNNQLMKGFKYTDEDYEKEFKENKTKYVCSDFLVYSFAYNDKSTDEEKAKLKEYATALSNTKNQKEFQTYLTNYMKSNPSVVNVPSSESSLTEEEFNSAIDTNVTSAMNKAVAYNDSNECYKWIFDEARKVNDTTVIDESNAYNAIMIVKPSYRDETVTRNVRHILVTKTTEGSDEAAKKKAESILDEWQNGAATEESFGELAEKYTEDPSTKTTGGLYEKVKPGDMVTEFNDWLFSKARKPGDTGIVKTSYGYHVMYFCGDGLCVWKNSADTNMRQKDIADEYEEMKKKYTVEFDEDTMKKMTLTMPEKEESDTDTTVPQVSAVSEQPAESKEQSE